ncbi:MAG: hypothetical protein ACI3VB_05345 [Oscillospiraceae bacterium]
MFYVGVAGFLLFFLSDLNDTLLKKRFLLPSFPLGAASVAVSMTVLAVRGEPPIESEIMRVCMWVLSALFLGFEIYTLFFAIPLADSYTKPGSSRCVCTVGVYALCRHPGVLWFGLLALSLWAAGGLPLYAAAVFTALDTALVVFEDIYVFPRRLEGYDDYRRRTPFLIPSVGSIKRCVGYYLHAASEDSIR